jgi:hypothetical protein
MGKGTIKEDHLSLLIDLKKNLRSYLRKERRKTGNCVFPKLKRRKSTVYQHCLAQPRLAPPVSGIQVGGLPQILSGKCSQTSPEGNFSSALVPLYTGKSPHCDLPVTVSNGLDSVYLLSLTNSVSLIKYIE